MHCSLVSRMWSRETPYTEEYLEGDDPFYCDAHRCTHNLLPAVKPVDLTTKTKTKRYACMRVCVCVCLRMTLLCIYHRLPVTGWRFYAFHTVTPSRDDACMHSSMYVCVCVCVCVCMYWCGCAFVYRARQADADADRMNLETELKEQIQLGDDKLCQQIVDFILSKRQASSSTTSSLSLTQASSRTSPSSSSSPVSVIEKYWNIPAFQALYNECNNNDRLFFGVRRSETIHSKGKEAGLSTKMMGVYAMKDISRKKANNFGMLTGDIITNEEFDSEDGQIKYAGYRERLLALRAGKHHMLLVGYDVRISLGANVNSASSAYSSLYRGKHPVQKVCMTESESFPGIYHFYTDVDKTIEAGEEVFTMYIDRGCKNVIEVMEADELVAAMQEVSTQPDSLTHDPDYGSASSTC